jgi:hypothetical protein
VQSGRPGCRQQLFGPSRPSATVISNLKAGTIAASIPPGRHCAPQPQGPCSDPLLGIDTRAKCTPAAPLRRPRSLQVLSSFTCLPGLMLLAALAWQRCRVGRWGSGPGRRAGPARPGARRRRGRHTARRNRRGRTAAGPPPLRRSCRCSSTAAPRERWTEHRRLLPHRPRKRQHGGPFGPNRRLCLDTRAWSVNFPDVSCAATRMWCTSESILVGTTKQANGLRMPLKKRRAGTRVLTCNRRNGCNRFHQMQVVFRSVENRLSFRFSCFLTPCW